MASVDHYHCKQRIFEWLQTVLCGMYSTEKLSLQFWRWQFFQQVILKLQRYWQVLDVLFFLNESKTTRVTIVCLTVKQKRKKKKTRQKVKWGHVRNQHRASCQYCVRKWDTSINTCSCPNHQNIKKCSESFAVTFKYICLNGKDNASLLAVLGKLH